MITRLAPQARTVVTSAEDEARARRSPVVEAEHLLLAMSGQTGTDASRALASAHLTHQAIEDALDHEFEASLTAAGVLVVAGRSWAASPPPRRRLRWSASSRAALSRAVTAASGAPQIRPAHLLLGILQAEVGTVPRALQLAGVDQAALALRARAELDAG